MKIVECIVGFIAIWMFVAMFKFLDEKHKPGTVRITRVARSTTPRITPGVTPTNSKEIREIAAKAAANFQVPESILLHILKTESSFGKNLGTPGIPARLNTARLRHNVAPFYKICRECGYDPQTVLGSSTGAMGPTQFQPNTWVQEQVDGNGNGKKCPFEIADAIYTQAHYLSNLAARFDAYKARNFTRLYKIDKKHLLAFIKSGFIQNRWHYAILRYAGVDCAKNYRYLRNAKRFALASHVSRN